MFQNVEGPSVVLGKVTRTVQLMPEGLDILYDGIHGDVLVSLHTTELMYEVTHIEFKQDEKSHEVIYSCQRNQGRFLYYRAHGTY